MLVIQPNVQFNRPVKVEKGLTLLDSFIGDYMPTKINKPLM
jgi:hypothetical protein